MKRRKFLKKTSNFALATALTPNTHAMELLSLQKDLNIPIIDTHQHLWDINRFKLKWPVPPIDNQSFLIPEYKKAVEVLNFVKSIYMEVDVPSHQRREEAIFAQEICKDPDNNTLKAVICANPSEASFRVFMKEFIGNRYIKGVRCRFASVGDMVSSTTIANLQWLGDQGLSFDLGILPAWLGEAENLVKACPETTFILNHCGNADPIAFFPNNVKRPRPPRCDAKAWKRNILNLGSYSNIYCKISGIISHVREFELSAELLRIPVEHCLDSFDDDKVIFASDWPVCLYNMSLEKWVNTLKTIVKSRTVIQQRKLFHDNAAYLYKV
ncbi:hypothetical protein DZC72_03170 [Maribacter algicola]|uniref:Amidohydrolase-related domain-containing protein n=1 Tax=Maribacter algicola TaxID=2498892 RepID=A0A3R8Q0B0_9FLAO|nr:amidohydrolase family protein [Maribacter algicola]RRQ49614.1 hypothetical protein DZC72_03170 [Maribacter algicola]